MPEAELSLPNTSVTGEEAARLVAVADDDVAGAGARSLVVVAEHGVAGDEAARLVAVAVDDVAGAGTEAELSSPDTRLPEMKPLDWLRSPSTTLPVPVPDAELSSPDTRLPVMKPLD